MMRKMALIVAIALTPLQASAESQFGVAVYPSAKPDASVTKALKEKLGVNGFAYRTTDAIPTVAGFYRKQPLEEQPGGNKESAAFTTRGGVMVTLQNPWMDMNTGRMVADTLISIVKN